MLRLGDELDERRFDSWNSVYVDVNIPRATTWSDLRALRDLSVEVKAGRVNTVCVDFAGDTGWDVHPFHPAQLADMGAEVLNAATEGDDLLRRWAERNAGGVARIPDDIDDFIAFFPTVASWVAVRLLREFERAGKRRGGTVSQRSDLDDWLHSLGQGSPYVAGREPVAPDYIIDEWVDKRMGRPS
jgi:hypothetical protein